MSVLERLQQMGAAVVRFLIGGEIEPAQVLAPATPPRKRERERCDYNCERPLKRRTL